tara:strand:- start:663 stop:1472 length:810 start_codon:yes stop_codon:yes gene_type:complete
MSQKTQIKICNHTTPPILFGPENPVLALASRHTDGENFPKHSHEYNQLICTDSGLVRISTTFGSWSVPPQRAVWIPSGTIHDVLVIGATEMRTVCIFPNAAPWLSPKCMVIEVSNLLRALFNEISRIELGYPLGGKSARLVDVLLDQLDFKPLSMLHLPLPSDKRILLISDTLLSDPSDRRTLNEWSNIAGASSRTLSRLFKKETGMSFRDWRLQLHMHEALAKLATGERVTEIAFHLGYNSPSSFISMFGQMMGQSPSRYMHAKNKES